MLVSSSLFIVRGFRPRKAGSSTLVKWFISRIAYCVKREEIISYFKSQISNCTVSLLLGEHARLSRK